MERVTIETQDGVTIIGSFEPVSGATSAALLLPMMPAVRQSFEPLQREFAKAGIASFAIDLRGHGESTHAKSGVLNYQKFNDQDHQQSRFDVDTALAFFQSKGFLKSQITVVGASIGANFAIDLLAREKNIKKAVLLSPGLDYRGVLTEPSAKNADVSQKILIVAAEGDSYSAQSSRQLAKILGNKGQLIIYPNSEHGTNMWKTNPELIPKIVEFLK